MEKGFNRLVDIWMAVDNGDDDGIDPLYKDIREASGCDDDEDCPDDHDGEGDNVGAEDEAIDRDELRACSGSGEEHEAASIDKTSEQTQLEYSDVSQGRGQINRNKSDQTLRADILQVEEPHQRAELDPRGEMRSVLMEMFEDSSPSQRKPQATSQDTVTPKADLTKSARTSKKRQLSSVLNSTKDDAEELVDRDLRMRRPKSKRLRTSKADGPEIARGMNEVISRHENGFAGAEFKSHLAFTESSAPQSLQTTKEETSRQAKNVAKDADNRKPNVVARKSNVTEGSLAPTEQHTHISKANGEGSGHVVFPESRGTKRPRSSSNGDAAPNASDDGLRPNQAKRLRLEPQTKPGDIKLSSDSSNTKDNVIEKRESNPKEAKTETQPPFFETQQDGKQLVRPTFFGKCTFKNRKTGKDELCPDNNEAGDLVVTSIRPVEDPGEYWARVGSTPAYQPGPRSWTADEEEMLRFWVQDNGICKWDLIAWCLRRTRQDCRKQFIEIVMARNKRAGRDPIAGLRGWVDPEL